MEKSNYYSSRGQSLEEDTGHWTWDLQKKSLDGIWINKDDRWEVMTQQFKMSDSLKKYL